MDKFIIVEDTREKNGWDFPDDECYAKVVSTKLNTGDYNILGLEEGILCIERKATVQELSGNIFEGRFKDCLARMSKHKHKFLILDFSMDDVLKYPVGSSIPKKKWAQLKVSGSFILSFLAQVMINYGVSVIFAGDRDNGALCALKIMKRVWANEK